MYPIVLSAPSEPGDLAFSALPHAPVVPPRPRRVGPARRVRGRTAAALHALAAAVEPAPRPRTARG